MRLCGEQCSSKDRGAEFETAEYASLSMCACVCLTVPVPAAWPENLATVVVASEEGMRLRARGERRLTAV